MKLTTLFMLAAFLHVSARGLSQKISIAEKNAPLEKLFREIRKQSGYEFLYNSRLVQSAPKVDIAVFEATVEETMKACLQKTNFTYTIQDKVIVISPRPAPGPKATAPSAGPNETAAALLPPAGIDVTVTVVAAENNQMLEGASVIVKGSNKGIATDINGRAILKNVDPNAIVVISFTGYQSQEVKISNRTSVGVRLTASTSELDEMQVIAYGTKSKRLQTGNVTTIKGEDIAKQPVSNALLALSGRVPGLFISQANGLPGTGITIQIEGKNSINRGTNPFYVIDGVPYTSQLLPSINAILGSSGSGFGTAPGNPFSFINPGDIESIEILKDADATAIYGSRAANGAILITTKKGKSGQAKVDVNIQNGWGKVTRRMELLNTQQFLKMRREAKYNDNAAVLSTDYDINGTWDTSRYTNWQKELIGRTAQYRDLQTTASAGNSLIQYLIGFGYHKETTVFPSELGDQKGSVHFNINGNSSNQKFKLQLSGHYLVDNNKLQFVDFTSLALRLSPNAPSLYDSDGGLNWSQVGTGATAKSTWTNPLANSYIRYSTKTSNLISNALVSYNLLPNFDLKTSFGYTSLSSDEFQGGTMQSVRPELRALSPRSAQFAKGSIVSWIIEPQATYRRTLGGGNLDVLIGATFQKNTSDRQQLSASGFNSDLVIEDLKSAATVTVSSTLNSIYRYNAIFGRLSYNWKNEFIFNLNGRRDGSSRFGSENLFHNFWSTSAAWIFADNTRQNNNSSLLSFGKIKTSFGTTGNDQIGDYAFMSLYSPPIGIDQPYNGATGLLSNGLSNPYLQWEETKKLLIGLDLGLFKDRLLFNVNYFRNRSSNQLLSYSLPITTGFTSITTNFPALVQNSGFEFEIRSTNINKKDFEWSTSINLTIPKNKLISFPSLATSSFASSLFIGDPITVQLVYHFLGVDPSTGLYLVSDRFGNPTSAPGTNPADKTVKINTSPIYYGGFQNTVRIKNVELITVFQFVKQIGQNYFFGNTPGNIYTNQPEFVLNHWQKSGDISEIQRFNEYNQLNTLQAYSAASGSDAAYSDASYIRLKNLSVSWNLPEDLKKRIHLKNCRVYAMAQNLFTITKYRGLDPENRSVTSLPPLRVCTIGLQFGL